MTGDEPKEPFLSRWARMKRDAGRDATEGADRARSADVADAVSVETATPPGADATAPSSDEEEFDLARLPPVDELTPETDVTMFLDRRVPAALRNAALSRVWTLDPTIRGFIEVAENQWNWNEPGGAPFYELIEPGSGASPLVADASSAISRALHGPPAEPVCSNIVEDAGPADPPAGLEETPTDCSASQQIGGVQDVLEPIDPTMDVDQHQRVAATVDADAAAQHEPPPDAIPQTAADVSARRRHGGALPA